jgi:beta-xylosidase
LGDIHEESRGRYGDVQMRLLCYLNTIGSTTLGPTATVLDGSKINDSRCSKMKTQTSIAVLLISTLSLAQAQNSTPQGRQKAIQTRTVSHQATTFCNPLNLDYTYKITESDQDISYRSGADPAVVSVRGEYYMFVTRALGYWYSKDLTQWHFIKPQRWYFQGSNAPAAHNYRDQLLYVTGDPSGTMSLLYTDDPKKGDWQAVPALLRNLQDPDFFMDDDGRAFMFWGSSNRFPIRGEELDPKHRFLPKTGPIELFDRDEAKHGWERFGENHDDPKLSGFIEGAWLTKHDGKYYMQYAAPGTEWNTYGDGVYVSSSPLGPYTYESNSPISYKPGGFFNGAGHGSSVVGPGGQFWHFGTLAIAV